ncbi:MAG TPA: acyl-CoA dehydrogenase family protein [Actinocrinis sp.]|uniref:acyl-CoA dehydrogenase family protein n=1 Tax=Actinocrinis sp. TaxID=1920516 RepID=UPI002D4D46C0|nr:acyl-CoA dehydrogenase family protein [Actinocrinis sp.]HZU56432.1 acyl-CoA dehydrogenase family protein [Actinocrinis sp.]
MSVVSEVTTPGAGPSPSALDHTALDSAGNNSAGLDSAALARAVQIAARHAAEADATGRLAPQVVEALREAGFARHFVGARWGGAEGTFTDLTAGVLALGRACASAAWTASLSAYSSRYASHLPEEGHAALWGPTPDAFVVAGLVPGGSAEAADGGWRLSGSWGYVSGVEFADWALLCAPASVSGADPEPYFFALARGSFKILETWDSVGMRATGSHTVVADDVFVPAHLAFPRSHMITGVSPASSAACHNVPFQAVGGLTFIAPAVGAAEGALAAASAALAGKRRTPGTDIELVRASGQVDVSRHLVEQNAAMLDAATFTPALMARNERNAVFAAELVAQAVAALATAAGTSGYSESAPLQRFWRDVTVMSSHIALRYETAAVRTYPPVLFAGHREGTQRRNTTGNEDN